MPSALAASQPLARLRRDLARLGRRRTAVRVGTAAASAGLLLLAGLILAFVLDYSAGLRPLQRAVALLGIAFAGGWLASTVVGRWLAPRESEADLALLVDGGHRLRGDLVAALQFQSSEASGWGSAQLERAVVREVDDASRGLDVFDGFSWRPLPVRAAAFASVLSLVVAAVMVFPRHAAIFIDRLTLADVPYPTRTVVTSLDVNGIRIDLAGEALLRVPAGASVTFRATTGGVTPDEGVVVIDAAGGGTARVPLARADTSMPSPSAGERTNDGAASAGDPRFRSKAAFSGRLDALSRPITFRIQLGDAVTRGHRIEVVPRPVIALDLIPTPPAYARANAPAVPPAGARSAFVLEGSSVGVVVRAVNKPLRDVALRLTPGPHDEARGRSASTFNLRPSRDRKTWTLDPVRTPFQDVRESLAFSITATDDEGLRPADGVSGTIRLRADRPPRVAAGAVVKQVLPTGKPELTYGASDDFGIERMQANVSVTRSAGAVEEFVVPLPIERASVAEATGRHSLDLSAYRLEKGDRLAVTVAAEDARGHRSGETGTAEPILFEVTDREGLLASLLEADEDGAARLDAIIRRELGIGGTR